MKQKIKEALQQGYKNLGISEKAFEGVAAFGTTFIKDEAEIENFVKGAEPMLKAFQGDADKLRGDYSKQIKDLEAQLANKKEPAEPKDEPNKGGNNEPDSKPLDELISAAVLKAVTPLTEKLNAYEAERNSESVVRTVQGKIETDYVNSYKKFKAYAWKHTLKSYEKGGKKATAEELEKDFFDLFNDLVTDKGGEIGKPIDNEGDADKEPDLDATIKMLRDSGKLPKESEK
jgi:hypothetical protein